MASDRMRLGEEAALKVLLIRAIETEDGDGAVLTVEDRLHASHAALAAVQRRTSGDGLRTSFLSRRAEIALERLTDRNPALARYQRAARWPSWLSLGLPIVALLLGLSTDAFAGERLNILAFPLLGLIGWNLVVYVYLTFSWLAVRLSGTRSGPGPVGRAVRWVISRNTSRLAAQPTLERGLVRFADDWGTTARSLTDARIRRTLHLGAAMFAVGVVTAMLLRARYLAEYSAGWSGTWAGAEQEIATVLGVVLGPAAWLTNIALPDPTQLRQLRANDQNAGNWLLLWGVTSGLFVIVPRLLLALLSGIKAALLRRSLPIKEDFYFRSLVRNALGEPGKARVVPYAIQPGPESRQRLERMLGSVLGEKVRVTIDPPVPYGAEDQWMTAEGERLGESDHLILLFGLSSTPEAENHGAFAEAVRKRLASGSTSLLALLEEGAFRRRLGSGPSAERRMTERLQSWRTILAAPGVEPTLIALEGEVESNSAQALERALLRSPATLS